jgi:hypothetical protein
MRLCEIDCAPKAVEIIQAIIQSFPASIDPPAKGKNERLNGSLHIDVLPKTYRQIEQNV